MSIFKLLFLHIRMRRSERASGRYGRHVYVSVHTLSRPEFEIRTESSIRLKQNKVQFKLRTEMILKSALHVESTKSAHLDFF